MKNKILLVMLVIFSLGCTINLYSSQDDASSGSAAVETQCTNAEDICTLGTPGLVNQNSIYSGSDTFFNIVLRNNLEGQEAYNVEVQLQNVGPFKIVEGYRVLDDLAGTCALSLGVWKPYELRTVFKSPNPQFVDDLGQPFAIHKLDVMYPDEEVEFQWRLRAPDYQEIANVAYEHNFDYVVSYDYKSGLLQTVYAISEDEYQRQLSLTGQEPTTKGVTTGSIGALSIASNVEEPVRVQGAGSQFSLIYEVQNERGGIPLTPAMFLLEYPKGVSNVGSFNSPNALEEYGYMDLMAGVKYYNDSGMGLTGGVCLPNDYDTYSDILSNARDNSQGVDANGNNPSCSDNFISISMDDLMAYLREAFPDLTIDENSPRFVIKFLYPVDLISDKNYLYYQMKTDENVDISKYYTFRLKTKYRYSFSGSDGILVVPNPSSFDLSGTTEDNMILWGDFNPRFDKTATSYSVNDYTLTMQKGDVTLASTVRPLDSFSNGAYKFLYILGLTSNAGTAESPALYSMDLGCYTMQSHVNTISSTNAGFLLTQGDTLYLFDEYPHKTTIGGPEKDDSSRADPANHNFAFSSDVSTISGARSELNSFIQDKCFFEVGEDMQTVLADNDNLSLLFDYNDYKSEGTDVPNDMKIINYYDNETLFMKDLVNNVLIGVYSSPIAGTDQMLLYYFNDDTDNTHVFDYNISLLTSTELAGQVSVNKVLKITSSSSALSAEQYNSMKISKDLGGGTKTRSCWNNHQGIKPILLISYRDMIVNTDMTTIVYDTGSIIIGDYTNLASVNSALGLSLTGTFIKGRVNLCYAS